MIRSRLFQNFRFCPSVTKKEMNVSAENFVKLYVESHNHLGFMTTHIQTNHQKEKQTNYSEHPSYNGFTNDVS